MVDRVRDDDSGPVVARLLNGLGDKSTCDQIASQLCPNTTSDSLRDEVAGRLHVDQGFLDSMARLLADSMSSITTQPQDEHVCSNIKVLCNADADFRRWLAVYLLKEVPL